MNELIILGIMFITLGALVGIEVTATALYIKFARHDKRPLWQIVSEL